MKRRGFLAGLLATVAAHLLPGPSGATLAEDVGISFVARTPQGVLLLRENMRIDFYDAATGLKTPPSEAAVSRVCKRI